MTSTLARPASSADGDPAGGDRSLLLLLAAAVLVLLVVGAVLLFGVERPPALASLADEPDPAPSAGVAWLAWSGDGSCLSVARPSGEVEQLWCDRSGGEVVGWPEAGTIEVAVYERGEEVRTIDAETGEVLERTSGPLRGDGGDRQVVWTEWRDGELTVSLDDDDTVLWRTEAPERYDVRGSARSADGEWVVMVDEAERLLVVPADGSAPPRVWASGVETWEPPVWEGTSRS
jgi:hypothetical protein